MDYTETIRALERYQSGLEFQQRLLIAQMWFWGVVAVVAVVSLIVDVVREIRRRWNHA